MKKSSILLALAIFLCSTTGAQTVNEILDKYFKAIGGLDKWKTLNSMKITGSIPTPQGEFAFEMYKKAPDKIKLVVNVMGQTMIPQAYDGETAWMVNPFAGNTPTKIPDEQVKDIKDEAIFEDPFIDYVKKGHEVTLEGNEDINGTKCYALKLVKNKGNAESESTEYYYFDMDSFLPIMVKHTMTGGQMSGQTIETYLSDYRDIGNGLVMAFSIETKSNGQSMQSITFKTIEANVDIPDDEFKFPATTEQVPATN